MIPLHDVVEQNDSIRSEIDTAISRVLDSGHFIGGREVSDFENAFSQYLNVKHTIGVGNATDGFEIAFKALDLDPGSEIIIPANAHGSPALAALNVGLKPTFCDVSSDRMLMDPDSVSNAITPKTKAIVVVHLYGRVCEMDRLQSICDSNELILIEDFSQAHGATYNGAKVGSFGKINVCSFYPTKPLGALGDGGAITTNNKELENKCRILAQYGWNPRDNSTLQGQNSRLDSLQAAILNVKLNHLDSWNRDRVAKATSLISELKELANIEVQDWEEGDICNLLPIRSAHRDRILQNMKAAGIACAVPFPIPIHQQPTFKLDQSHPNAEACCAEVLSVPLNSRIIEHLSE